MKLIVVESPSKAKTINKYLGKGYLVVSSKGHLVDLPKSRLAIDVNNNFKPEYKVVHGRAKDMKLLRQQAANADEVLLAADPDREGEAISWHLKNAFESVNPKIHRISFNEITAEAIKESLNHPGDIDVHLVNAQQARRIMDRLVGYNLSPLLWKKVKAGLSAGRVQSVAMRIICEREDEIDRFKADEYWEMDIVLGKEHHHFPARLVKVKDERIDRIPDKAGTERIIEDLKRQQFKVTDSQEKPIRRKPYPPYTTSKLQQDSVNRLGFTAKKTMQLAQQLYEGVQLKREGLTGLITYMRTDSTRVSALAMEQARQFVTDAYGKDYIPETANIYASGKDAQDAHEAIRPTSVFRSPESLQESLDKQQLRLYKMIWERFVASQMSDSITKNVQVTVMAGDYTLMISGSRIQFPGFNKVYSSEVKDVMVKGIEKIVIGDMMSLVKADAEQKFTQPPPRFTDASLVKDLEESGIGRPSTYAPTISTLLVRYYVTRSGKQLIPTFLGKIVNKLLVENFPEILNTNFTARMEKELDEIADNKRDWVATVKDFYDPFSVVLEKAHKNIDKLDFKTDEKTDLICEKCGSPMLKKLGRYGYFLACSAFPKCRNIKSIPLGKCPRKGCEGDTVKKKGQRGRSFYGCTKYPECTFTTYYEVLEDPCPKCGKILVKFSENKTMIKKCLNEECQYKEPLEK